MDCITTHQDEFKFLVVGVGGLAEADLVGAQLNTDALVGAQVVRDVVDSTSSAAADFEDIQALQSLDGSELLKLIKF